MCWISRELDEQIATKDITVYKIVTFNTESCNSLYRNFKYQYNKLYTTLIIIQESDYKFYINKGFHSYINLKIIYFIEDVTKGCIAECTIPKGAIYYTNAYGEVVSNQIIIHIPQVLIDIKQFLENSK